MSLFGVPTSAVTDGPPHACWPGFEPVNPPSLLAGMYIHFPSRSDMWLGLLPVMSISVRSGLSGVPVRAGSMLMLSDFSSALSS